MTVLTNRLAACPHQVEHIYFTKDRFLAVTINGSIHWISDTLITVSCGVAMLKRLNVDFMKKSHKWGLIDERGQSLKYKSDIMTKLKIDDDDIFIPDNGYLTITKKSPSGGLWWSIQELEDTYFKV